MGAALSAAAVRIGAPHGRRDAATLLARALGSSVAAVVTDRRRIVPSEALVRFSRDVDRLANHEPIAYVLGSAPFLDFELEVSPAVLIPRQETELLAEWAIARARARGCEQAVDVGTGSGALAIALARHVDGLVVHATDISPAALEVAERNAARLGVGSRIRFHLADLFPPGGLPEATLVVANLPYVADVEAAEVDVSVRRHEPHGALFGGTDGLTPIRRLCRQLPWAVAAKADVGLEIAPRQAPQVLALVRRAYEFHQVMVRRDFTGRDRFALAEARSIE